MTLYPEPVLRRRAEEVKAFTPDLVERVKEMFRIMEEEGGIGLAAPQAGWSARVFITRIPDGEEEGVPATAVIGGHEEELNSSYFRDNTYVTTGQFGEVLLVFEWNSEGRKISEEVTGRLIGEPLGIYLSGEPLLGDDGVPIAPIVRSKITDSGQIEGLSLNEAQELSQLLNAGRIPLPLKPIYDQTVSPILGADFIDMSIKAGIIGILLVMLFMIVSSIAPNELNH